MKRNINLIGISGKIGSGKDLTARLIQKITGPIPHSYGQVNSNGKFELKNYKPTWEIKKFATKIKQACALFCNENVDNFEDPAFKNLVSPFGITYRQLLQKVGTEAMRDTIDSDFWVKALFVDFHTPSLPDETTFIGDENKWISERSPKWIITDVRFPNEAKAIKDRGGILVRVDSNFINVENGKTTRTYPEFGEHISETALDDYKDWDFIIFNNGTIEDLEGCVKLLMDEFAQ